MNVQDSDIADGIVPEKKPEHIAAPRSTFLPWHKVRKQFIRRNQWNELTVRNVNDRWRRDLDKPSAITEEKMSAMHAMRPLRCLMIPGDDLLDMRALWNEISPLDCFIYYLGFNESHGSHDIGTDVHVANNVVTSLAGVLPNSQVLQDRFESITSDSSLAYRYLRDYGPYHIVNLDLCGSMFPNTEKQVTPYFDALLRLLKYQFETQKLNWLLFITTQVKPSAMDHELMQKLCKPTRENCDVHSAFTDKMADFFPHLSLKHETFNINLEGLSDIQIVRLFGVALGKWLLRLGQSPSPKWTVAMRRSFQYTINEEKGAIMLSLAFEMTPNLSPPVDASGMSSLAFFTRDFPTEVACAIKLVDSVTEISDVDAKLVADATLKNTLLHEAADLMESAGYDREKYVQWVTDGELDAQSRRQLGRSKL